MKSLVVCAFGLCMACMRAPAPMWARPTAMPVERVIENLATAAQDRPDDQELFVNLGRAYSYQLKFGDTDILVFTEDEQVTSIPPRENEGLEEGREHSDLERVQILTKAVEAFGEAIRIKPDEPLPYLGMADLMRENTELAKQAEALPDAAFSHDYEQFDRDHFVEKITSTEADQIQYYLAKYFCHWLQPQEYADKRSRVSGPDPDCVDAVLVAKEAVDPEQRKAILASIQTYWELETTHYYLKAFTLAYPEEAHRNHRPMGGFRSLIAWEAGTAYLSLMEELGPRGYDGPRISLVQKGVEELEELPHSQMRTPIIFSLNTPASLESLLAPETTVNFDLDGTGREQSWPWVSPEASILVWDPEENGEVTSGRQLFGSVTWWLFFETGYRAMDALDDNRDGELSGYELVGLGVWTDANSNGVSDAGEVVPIAETGIEAIACVQTDTAMGMPANLLGLRMNDGRVLPTYDWIAESKMNEEQKR